MSNPKKIKTSLDCLYEVLAEQETQALKRLACEKQMAMYNDELVAICETTRKMKLGETIPTFRLNHCTTQVCFNSRPYFPKFRTPDGRIPPKYAEVAKIMSKVCALHPSYKANAQKVNSNWGVFGMSTVYGTDACLPSQFIQIGFPPFKYGSQVPYPSGEGSIRPTAGQYRIAVNGRKFWNSL